MTLALKAINMVSLMNWTAKLFLNYLMCETWMEFYGLKVRPVAYPVCAFEVSIFLLPHTWGRSVFACDPSQRLGILQKSFSHPLSLPAYGDINYLLSFAVHKDRFRFSIQDNQIKKSCKLSLFRYSYFPILCDWSLGYSPGETHVLFVQLKLSVP